MSNVKNLEKIAGKSAPLRFHIVRLQKDFNKFYAEAKSEICKLYGKTYDESIHDSEVERDYLLFEDSGIVDESKALASINVPVEIIKEISSIYGNFQYLLFFMHNKGETTDVYLSTPNYPKVSKRRRREMEEILARRMRMAVRAY